MRRLFATLLALLAGCGSGLTGGVEDNLRIESISVRSGSPAVVRASLDDPSMLPDLIWGLERMKAQRLRASSPLSTELQTALDSSRVPVEIDFDGQAQSPLPLSIGVEGINWQPSYSWDLQTARPFMEGIVRIHNATGRGWQAESVVVLDRDGTVLARALEADIPLGSTEYPWWRSSGSTGRTVISFGWPIPDRAVAMTPFFPDTPGPVIFTEQRRSPLPVYMGDTLWLPADDELELIQSTRQLEDGYSYTVVVKNLASRQIEFRLRLPQRLPRGANLSSTTPEGDIRLSPGESDSIGFSYIYAY